MSYIISIIFCILKLIGIFSCWYVGSVHKSVKHRIDGFDKQNFIYSYTIIESDALDVFKSISYHIKIVATPDEGSICKNMNIYQPKGDAQVSEEEIKIGKERASGIFKKVKAYLLENPDA